MAGSTSNKAPGNRGFSHSRKLSLSREEISDRYAILCHGGGSAGVNWICDSVRFEHPAAYQLLALLPRTIIIDAWNAPPRAWIASTLRLIAAEAKALRPGSETIITRLADILVIQAIRSWIADDSAAQTGWLGALQDTQIGRAILLVQRDPARGWTVAALADEVAMSRSWASQRCTLLPGGVWAWR